MQRRGLLALDRIKAAKPDISSKLSKNSQLVYDGVEDVLQKEVVQIVKKGLLELSLRGPKRDSEETRLVYETSALNKNTSRRSRS